MDVMDDVLRFLREVDGQVTSEIIRDLIEDHLPERNRMLQLYKRYRTDEDGVPIFTREMPDYQSVNNKLNNDFFSEIIDTKLGYFLGKPIVYDVEDGAPDEVEETIQDFRRRNNVEDLDSETGKFAAICGYGARLLYIDEEGQERAMNLKPWEVIFIYDRSIEEPQYAVRYYPVKVKENGKESERWRVEWYDSANVTFFIENEKGEFIPDETEPTNPKPHMFDGVPVVEFPNNEERQGDAEKVIPLIDAYDRTLSDVNSEIEAFRLAYLAFYGFKPTPEDIEMARRTGAFGIPDGADGQSKIEFITKNLDDNIVEHHLDRLEANIMRFAKTVNFTDEQFAGNLSGVAMRFKLFALESKCITAERKFTAALRRQFKLLATAWQKKQIPVDYTKIKFQFTRNLPVNLLDEAQTSATLKGLVSERTRLSLLSFITDVEAELEQMEREALDLGGGLINELGPEPEGGGQESGPTPDGDGTGTDPGV